MMYVNTRLIHAGVASMLLSSAASAQFQNATISAVVSAESRATRASDGETLESLGGGPFFGFYKGLAVNFAPSLIVGKSLVDSSASQSTNFTQTTITSQGSAASDIDDQDNALTAGIARGQSSLTVVFELTRPHTWSFDELSIGGVHAGGSVSLYTAGNPGTEIFTYVASGTQYDGETGLLTPGIYVFTADILSFTDRNDGFGGLFAGVSYTLTFRLTAPPCAGDANGDGVVTFLDITTVLANFGTIYSPGTGSGDADANGEVTFLDITTVLANFGNSCA